MLSDLSKIKGNTPTWFECPCQIIYIRNMHLFIRFDEIKAHIKTIRNSKKIRDVSRAQEGTYVCTQLPD